MTVIARLVGVLFAIGGPAVDASAQADTIASAVPDTVSHWMRGGIVMIPRLAGSLEGAYSVIGVSAMTRRVNRLGADVALGVIAAPLGYLTLSVAARTNVALPLRIAPTVLLVPSAGVTVVGSVGLAGTGVSSGVNGAATLIVFDRPIDEPGGKFGLRLGLATYRIIDSSRGTLETIEVGFVWRR